MFEQHTMNSLASRDEDLSAARNKTGYCENKKDIAPKWIRRRIDGYCKSAPDLSPARMMSKLKFRESARRTSRTSERRGNDVTRNPSLQI